LPKWAREHIHHLETRSEPAIDRAVKATKELDRVKATCRRLQNANDSIIEILRHAGKGGVDWAQTVVDILDSYEIFKSGSPEEIQS
jgi:hypothetical protein